MQLTQCLNGFMLGMMFWSVAASSAPSVAAAQLDGTDLQASQVVDRLHGSLLEIMQNAGNLGFSGRYEIMAPVIGSSFDTPLICKVVLGSYWKELDTGAQTNFIQLFQRLSASTYASRFDSYEGESFNTLGAEQMKSDRLLLKTEMIREKEDPVRFDYLLQQKDGKWYIISVVADGVNDLALKRAEYANIIKTRGFDSLVSDIEIKIKDLEAPPVAE